FVKEGAGGVTPKRQAGEGRATPRLKVHSESGDFARNESLAGCLPESIESGANIGGARPIPTPARQFCLQAHIPAARRPTKIGQPSLQGSAGLGGMLGHRPTTPRLETDFRATVVINGTRNQARP